MKFRWSVLSLVLILLTSIPTLSSSVSPSADESGLLAFDLLTPEEGWVLVNQRLYWTHTGGHTWQDITPPDLPGAAVSTVAFKDTHNGWLATMAATPDGIPTYRLARTVDGGHTWQSFPLWLFEPEEVSAYAGALYLYFLDTETGWLVVKQVTGSNFSQGTFGTGTPAREGIIPPPRFGESINCLILYGPTISVFGNTPARCWKRGVE